MKNVLRLLFLSLLSIPAVAQVSPQTTLDSLKREILAVRTEVNSIQINLAMSKKKFQRGIVVATIGYSVTIAGGLMLGRAQDDLGKVLLVTGGTTGLIGTVMLVDAFKYLSPKKARYK